MPAPPRVAGIAAPVVVEPHGYVVLRFGERPEVAFVLPISVDGMLIVASTAMVEDRIRAEAAARPAAGRRRLWA